MRFSSLGLVAVLGLASVAVACAAGGENGEPDAAVAPDGASGSTKDASGSQQKDAQSPTQDGSTTTTYDAGAGDATLSSDASDASPPKAIVYGHSPDTLYTLDVDTNAVTAVAPFSGCAQGTNATTVIDLAIDSQMNAYVTTFDGFYSLDLTTAQCTLVAAGAYPNSLSFVPAGTLDPNVEALVGYSGSSYLRIDPSTGNVTFVGTLSGGYASSGDIVSVEGGGTFLTVTGNGCADCLLQVNPATGDMVQSYGALPHGAVYGLGYWGGNLYGFDSTGDLFLIGGDGDGGIATSDIVVDGGVIWYGAGSTTIAPPTALDGGAIPTQ